MYVVFSRKNLQFFEQSITNGSIDYFFVKPIKLKLILPFIQFDFRHTYPILFTLFVLGYLLVILKTSILQVFFAIILFTNGITICYLINLIFVLFALWGKRSKGIFEVFFEMHDVVRVPIEFFPIILKFAFIFLLPIILILNPSFQILFGNFDIRLTIIAILTTLILLVISNIVWKKGMKAYSSAN